MSTQEIGFQSYLNNNNVAPYKRENYQQWEPIKKCLHTPTLLFSREHVNYYIAAKPDRLDKAPKNAVYVSFCGDYLNNHPVVVVHDARFLGLEEQSVQYSVPALCVDWSDFDVPALKKTFWRVLHEKLAALDPKEVNVVFYCAGGHGRSGTAITAMLIDGTWNTDEALEYVRKGHCKSTVETSIQEDYLYQLDFELNGRKIPKKESVVTTYSTTPSSPTHKLTKREKKERRKLLCEQWNGNKTEPAFTVDLDGGVTDSNHYNAPEWWRE